MTDKTKKLMALSVMCVALNIYMVVGLWRIFT